MSGSRAAREPAPSELNTSGCSLAFLEVGKDKLTVRYNGPAQHDNDVGSIQANHPVPRRRLVYYFEVAVREASGGSITLGFSDPSFKQGRHPGYEPHSYGYRGDTGRKHHGGLPLRGEQYGPAFGPGDVVGAGMHLSKHEIFFTKNGHFLGTAFRNVTGHPLFPTVGLHSQGAAVEVNFGRQPFQFDVAALAARERAQLAAALDSASVSAGEVHQLVRGYLLHHGYAASLAAFDAAAGMAEAEAAAVARGAGGMHAEPRPASSGDAKASSCGTAGASSSGREAGAPDLLPARAQLRQHLMAGDTAAALALLRQHMPGLLGEEAGGGPNSGSFELQFQLACQQYIELIRRNDIPGALAFAGDGLSRLRGASPEHDARLREVVALIAYQQPEQSPLAGLLAPAQREATADIANAAILRWRAPPGAPEPRAALERVLQQLTAVQRELHELAGGHGPEFDLQEHLPQPPAAEMERGGGEGGSGGAVPMTE